ncbi:hypothetical protein F4813DRAFT_363516 [Daldinia decipiens]|uniref:uncharacterized protein n=1 Tax=Daldinia decipiens TaxID=326647 RepID=UPI0020C26D1B|nr:uncharacterized protein F4813DRAFT_363516 [Daldinia decipiens]KAI1656528.1 hypothetical protein F4813DRAFT_363516 [Daldinia decipiens]
MDKGTTNGVEPWRQTRLGDEPIYCAAPTPLTPDDIICLGSDEELDDDEKLARRLRYEAQALRYLQGKPVRVLSASLHGPFDKASGWKNPWLPKQPTTKKSVLKSSQYPTKPIPPFRDHIHKVSQRLGQQYGSTPGTASSARCHLPSPESNRELQFSSNTSETEKHSRIQAWAKEVSKGAILERDAFWAPEVLHEDNDEPRKKRPAGKEWLKKTSKRKRLSSPQSTHRGSTPTPLLPTQPPVRSTSVPINARYLEKSGYTKLKVSQSFEFATPSSTLSPSHREVKYEREVKVPTQGKMMPSPDELSNGIQLDVKDTIVWPTSTAVNSTHDQFLLENKECKPVLDPERGNHSNESFKSPISQEAQVGQEAEEEPAFESYIDQSFHYRARLPIQASPVTGPNVSAMSVHSKLTQTGMPESPGGEDAVATAIPENRCPLENITMLEQYVNMESVAIAQASVDLLESMCSRGKNDDIQSGMCQPAPSALNEDRIINGNSDEQYKCNETIGCTTVIETGLSSNQKTYNENPYPAQVDTTGISILAETANALHTENRATENDIPDVVTNNSQISHIVLNVETTRNTNTLEGPATLETHPTKFGLLVDEGSTLIGDPMNFNRASPIEANGLLTLNHVSNNADIKAEAHDPIRNLVRITRELESDTESDPVIVPLSQLEWDIGEDKLKIVVANDEEAPEDTLTKASLLDPPESFTRESPWVSDYLPGANLTTEHIKLEPIEYESSRCPYLSQTMLPGSQTGGHEVPKIGPSQQSPWENEILESAKPDRRDWYSTTVGETTHANALLSTTTSKKRRSPSPTTELDMVPRSECPPISPTPATSDKDSLFPPPQSPIVTHESDIRFSEHRASPPTTPPRMSVLHMRTPDLERSIKPFSLFNTPSPKRQRRNSKQYSSTNRTVGILLNATHLNPRSSEKSTRRVSFALLPDEDNADTPPVFNTTRATSPPPQIPVNTGDEDIDNQFQGHFDAMKRRANDRNVRLRLQSRLLPSPSQQKLTSPHIGAMAEAFREADAYSAYAREDLVKNEEGCTEDVAENIVEDMADIEQSPWRKESQGIDHVADVMENLDEFINAWDVNVELQKARQERGRDSLDGEAFW